MARSNQKKADDAAFPVRVILQGLAGGFAKRLGPGRDPHQWLDAELGAGNAAFYGWRTPYVTEGYALYTRSLADALRFLEAFPEFEIADGTVSDAYSSVFVWRGKRRP